MCVLPYKIIGKKSNLNSLKFKSLNAVIPGCVGASACACTVEGVKPHAKMFNLSFKVNHQHRCAAKP